MYKYRYFEIEYCQSITKVGWRSKQGRAIRGGRWWPRLQSRAAEQKHNWSWAQNRWEWTLVKKSKSSVVSKSVVCHSWLTDDPTKMEWGTGDFKLHISGEDDWLKTGEQGEQVRRQCWPSYWNPDPKGLGTKTPTGTEKQEETEWNIRAKGKTLETEGNERGYCQFPTSFDDNKQMMLKISVIMSGVRNLAYANAYPFKKLFFLTSANIVWAFYALLKNQSVA